MAAIEVRWWLEVRSRPRAAPTGEPLSRTRERGANFGVDSAGTLLFNQFHIFCRKHEYF